MSRPLGSGLVFSSCLTFTTRTHDLGAKHHQPRTPQHTHTRQDSRRHRKVLTHLRFESCRQVAEAGSTWDSRSRSSLSPWGFWEPQTTFLMNQNTREITLWTVVIYCSTPPQKAACGILRFRVKCGTVATSMVTTGRRAYPTFSPGSSRFLQSWLTRPGLWKPNWPGCRVRLGGSGGGEGALLPLSVV